MKAMHRAALMVAAFVLLLPLPARSQIREGSLELGAFGGFNFFENKQNLKNRGEFGGRLGYNFTKHLGVEIAGEFINTRVDDKGITGTKEGQFRSPADEVELTFYHIDAVYHFTPDSKFTPFVLVGVGGAHYEPKISTKDMAALNVGLGAKYWLTDNIALRVDVRDYMVTEIVQETYHNLGVTFGITFAFGGKAKPQAQAAKYEAQPEPARPAPARPAPARPAPAPVPVPGPKAVEPVVILAAEPKAEEKVIALVAQPKIEEKVIVLAFEDIHFDFDKSTLKPEAQTILKRNIQLLKTNPKANVRIAGYTSASGTADYNQGLSQRRAKAVRDYLVNEGLVAPDRLAEIGYGETRPAMYEAAPKDLYSTAARANMRVLFEIIVK